MPRKKESPNIWQQWSLASDHAEPARYALFGDYDVEQRYLDQNADGRGEWRTEPVTNPTLVRWIDALMAFDDRDHHDAAPLIAMLESGAEMPPIVGIWLADLMRRHDISADGIEDYAGRLRSFVPTLKAGRPATAAYDMSDRDVELTIANNQITNYLEANGGRVADALTAIASKVYPNDTEAQKRFENTLRLFRKGQHTSARKAAKRRR
jgi:hypothetical protein